jgi:DNA-binding NarL/FixJ family response regulator
MTDLRMPRLDGIQLTRYIRRDLPGTRIIMISSYAEDTYWLMASDSRADAFVSKRMLHSSLLPAVLDVIRRDGASAPAAPQD